jgi:hypothetical protein
VDFVLADFFRGDGAGFGEGGGGHGVRGNLEGSCAEEYVSCQASEPILRKRGRFAVPQVRSSG